MNDAFDRDDYVVLTTLMSNGEWKYEIDYQQFPPVIDQIHCLYVLCIWGIRWHAIVVVVMAGNTCEQLNWIGNNWKFILKLVMFLDCTSFCTTKMHKATIFEAVIPIVIFSGCILEEHWNPSLPLLLMESMHINVKIISQYTRMDLNVFPISHTYALPIKLIHVQALRFLSHLRDSTLLKIIPIV